MADDSGTQDETATGAGEQSGDQTENGSGDGKETPSAFTQDDLNRFAGTARKEARLKILKDLDVETLEELQTIVQAKQKADDQAKTDLDRALEAKAAAEAETKATEDRMFELLLRSEFRVAAADKVSDVDLAYLAAQAAGLLNDGGSVEVDPEALAVRGLDTVIEKLLKDKPILKKTQPAQQSTDGAQGGDGRGKKEIDEATLRARFGI